jgi:hypothetical protein
MLLAGSTREQHYRKGNLMRLHHVLGLAAVLTLSQPTPAASPIPPKALGPVEATVDFCIKADSKSADQYKQWGKSLVREMSEKELVAARNSDEYKEAYAGIKTELEKIPAEKAAGSCRAALEQSDK